MVGMQWCLSQVYLTVGLVSPWIHSRVIFQSPVSRCHRYLTTSESSHWFSDLRSHYGRRDPFGRPVISPQPRKGIVNRIGTTTINIKVSGWWSLLYLTPSLCQAPAQAGWLWCMWVQYPILICVMASGRHLVLEVVSLLEQIYSVYDYWSDRCILLNINHEIKNSSLLQAKESNTHL